MRGGGGDVPSIISVLLSKDSTECGNVRVNGREHSEGENTCQYHILRGVPREEERQMFMN
jgi:hypothetical protein